MKKLLFCFFILTKLNAQPDYKLAVQTWTFHKFSFLESIDKADSCGINYLEVYPGQKIGGTLPGVFSYTMDKDVREKVKHYLKWSKKKVIALGVVDKYYYTRENLEQFFIFCKEMEIPFLTAEPETADLDLFNQLAGKYNIKVALHCHPKPDSHYWHPDSTVKAMKGKKNIGAWPDIGHWARNGVNVTDALKKMQGKLWGMHFKDIREFNNLNAEDTLLGKGVCDIPAVIREMKRQKFKGVISIEHEVHEYNNIPDVIYNRKYLEAELKKPVQ